MPKPRAVRSTPGLAKSARPSALTPTKGEIRVAANLFARIPDDELRAALETCEHDGARRLLTILDDRAYAETSMAGKIRAANMTVAEVLRAITTMHDTDADLRVARRLPDIMEQMAIEAAPRLGPCSACHPEALTAEDAMTVSTAEELAGEMACRRCGGRGVVIVDADNDVRKMLLEAQGKLGSKGPLVDARQVHMHGGRKFAGAPDMTDWSRATDAAFEVRTALTAGSVEVLDAED